MKLQNELRSAMQGMIREIRQKDSSQNIVIDENEGQDRILFYMVDVTNPITYYVDSSDMLIRDYDHPDANYPDSIVLANNITNLEFTESGSTLEIKLGAEKSDIRGRLSSLSLAGKVRYRN